MLRFLIALGAVVAVSMPLAAGGTPGLPQLDAKVTARSISLTDAQGQRVRSLPQNSYRINVKDVSKTQNFHLVGPLVNMKTKVAATGMRSWVVNLRPGTYVYKSDRKPKLYRTFTVESNPPPA
jgi:hypothetical protein